MGYTHACYGDVEQLHEQGGTAETYDARFAQREATVGEANNDILRELVEQRSYDGLQDHKIKYTTFLDFVYNEVNHQPQRPISAEPREWSGDETEPNHLQY